MSKIYLISYDFKDPAPPGLEAFFQQLTSFPE
jgi:hypothetical protein